MKKNQSKIEAFYRNNVTMAVAILGTLAALLLLIIVLRQKSTMTAFTAAAIMLFVCADTAIRCITIRKEARQDFHENDMR